MTGKNPNVRYALLSALVATLLLMLVHIMIRFGSEWAYHAGATVLFPGVVVEMKLSGDNFEGFGDWRTPLVINAVTWLLGWLCLFAALKLWNPSPR